jgi:hypothetical protein
VKRDLKNTPLLPCSGSRVHRAWKARFETPGAVYLGVAPKVTGWLHDLTAAPPTTPPAARAPLLWQEGKPLASKYSPPFHGCVGNSTSMLGAGADPTRCSAAGPGVRGGGRKRGAGVVGLPSCPRRGRAKRGVVGARVIVPPTTTLMHECGLFDSSMTGIRRAGGKSCAQVSRRQRRRCGVCFNGRNCKVENSDGNTASGPTSSTSIARKNGWSSSWKAPPTIASELPHGMTFASDF